MQVSKITTPFFKQNNRPNLNIQNRENFGIRMTSPIDKDTVSFGEKRQAVLADALEKSVEKEIPRLKRIGTVFLDALEVIAIKLKDSGVAINREYCETNLIKTPASYRSKVVRSKSFLVHDQIRATYYCKDLYDLSILNDLILPELAKRGYKIADTSFPIEELMKKGYIPKKNELEKGYVNLPDLDIRLDDVEDQVQKLDSRFKYSVSKSQASGYEDIQMRLVRDSDKKKPPVLFELIILFGENYANAKHHESEQIYKYARQFGEMNFLKSESQADSIKLAKRYVSLIKKFLSTEISSKAFENAKNIDVYGIDKNAPIKVTPKNLKTFIDYFDELENQMYTYYKNELKNAGDDVQLRKTLFNNRKEDKARFEEIKQNLLNAIDFYNNQKHLKMDLLN